MGKKREQRIGEDINSKIAHSYWDMSGFRVSVARFYAV
jgi:hypothetical protein